MATFQFAVDNDTVLSLREYQYEFKLESNPCIESTEGIYKHGKVNADNKEEATKVLSNHFKII